MIYRSTWSRAVFNGVFFLSPPFTTVLQLKSQHAYVVNLPGCDNYRSKRPRVPFHFQIMSQLPGREISLYSRCWNLPLK